MCVSFVAFKVQLQAQFNLYKGFVIQIVIIFCDNCRKEQLQGT